MRISITTVKPPPSPPQPDGTYFIGLHDYQANDPIVDPDDIHQIYCPDPFYPRNWPSRPPVPEVRRFKYSGDALYLTEPLEWMWFYSFWLRSGLTMGDALFYYQRHTRKDAGYTNKVAWNSTPPRRSFVLGLNPGAKLPMQLLGIVCPGSNVFRWTGSQAAIKKEQTCEAVWNLDYDWLVANLTMANARDFAASLPNWLLHTARIVHPERIGPPTDGAPNGVFKVTNWDGNFCVPLITSEGRREIVDGFHVRENWLQQNRLKKI